MWDGRSQMAQNSRHNQLVRGKKGVSFHFFWSPLDNQKALDYFSWKRGGHHKGNWVLGTLCVLGTH